MATVRTTEAAPQLKAIADRLGVPVSAFYGELVRHPAKLASEMLTALIAAEVGLSAGATADERAKARSLVRDCLNKTEAD
jgi:hypothetical protein